jgi:UDP-N-acetylglucosamine--N-acetylmuramyl-(pentapeptide) pyrophosphoryl-undecaprenol N-acetylglucosamine transferase
MAGGTGGHVFPALAVANYMQARGFEVTWLGTPHRMEAKLVPAHGFQLDTIKIDGLRGRGMLSLLMAPWRLLESTWQAFRIIKHRNPDVVLGMGGFASGPGGVAAWLLRKPLIIHEQNAVAGLTNTLLAKLAQTVCESFPDTFTLAKKLHYTGNPVREAILAIPAPAERYQQRSGPLRLLILGGSLGAKAINETLPQALAKLPEDKRPEVWHQCGEQHAQTTEAAYSGLGVKVKLTPFIQDMAQAYAWADYVVARAGALTVTEIIAAGLPAVFIPFPQAVDDHQTKNAQMLVKAGAADLIQQRSLSADKLADLFMARYQDRAELLSRAEQARALMQSHATALVAQFCMEAAGATV